MSTAVTPATQPSSPPAKVNKPLLQPYWLASVAAYMATLNEIVELLLEVPKKTGIGAEWEPITKRCAERQLEANKERFLLRKALAYASEVSSIVAGILNIMGRAICRDKKPVSSLLEDPVYASKLHQYLMDLCGPLFTMASIHSSTHALSLAENINQKGFAFAGLNAAMLKLKQQQMASQQGKLQNSSRLLLADRQSLADAEHLIRLAELDVSGIQLDLDFTNAQLKAANIVLESIQSRIDLLAKRGEELADQQLQEELDQNSLKQQNERLNQQYEQERTALLARRQGQEDRINNEIGNLINLKTSMKDETSVRTAPYYGFFWFRGYATVTTNVNQQANRNNVQDAINQKNAQKVRDANAIDQQLSKLQEEKAKRLAAADQFLSNIQSKRRTARDARKNQYTEEQAFLSTNLKKQQEEVESIGSLSREQEKARNKADAELKLVTDTQNNIRSNLENSIKANQDEITRAMEELEKVNQEMVKHFQDAGVDLSSSLVAHLIVLLNQLDQMNDFEQNSFDRADEMYQLMMSAVRALLRELNVCIPGSRVRMVDEMLQRLETLKIENEKEPPTNQRKDLGKITSDITELKAADRTPAPNTLDQPSISTLQLAFKKVSKASEPVEIKNITETEMKAVADTWGNGEVQNVFKNYASQMTGKDWRDFIKEQLEDVMVKPLSTLTPEEKKTVLLQLAKGFEVAAHVKVEKPAAKDTLVNLFILKQVYDEESLIEKVKTIRAEMLDKETTAYRALLANDELQQVIGAANEIFRVANQMQTSYEPKEDINRLNPVQLLLAATPSSPQ